MSFDSRTFERDALGAGKRNKYQSHGTQLETLRQDAKRLLSSTSDPCVLLNHVDSMQRLGIAYHFQEEINDTLKNCIHPYSPDDQDLHTTALRFRVLRDHNFPVSSGCQDKHTKSFTLIELAKLDFNIVQATYQEELKELSRWWENLGFKRNRSFTRDRLIQSYFVAIGITFEPQSSKSRIAATKFINIVNTIDDIHDYYGSLDDLKLFDAAVKRWDLTAMEFLPDYMKICYFAMYNMINELSYDALIDRGIDVLPCLREACTKFYRSVFVEAQWYYNVHTPSLDNYLKNSSISIAILGSLNFAHAQQKESRSSITNNSLPLLGRSLLYWSSVICRLNNDLATFQRESETGEMESSVKCYMVEKGVSQKEACDGIRGLIRHAWKMLNTERTRSDLPPSMVKMCFEMPKLCQCLYQHGDGFGTSIELTKDVLTSLIFRQIPI
ncbi:3R-linalool synthase [Tripterygium wilfordii]|uniref:3R-linalool synthase n=1 Tax=Tripterygium wilfordii TaxID=458696 RepID=A0A7J7CGB0_TRIWF|nr:3R-linalool synthase [Tripterygium wilfordii]